MPTRFFPSARESRDVSRNNLVIFNEVRTIEEQILNAQTSGLFSVTVDTTDMTYYPAGGDHFMHSHLISSDFPSTDYYRVWKGYDADTGKEEQMNTVIEYFEDLSYSIYRSTNTQTSKTFVWIVKW